MESAHTKVSGGGSSISVADLPLDWREQLDDELREADSQLMEDLEHEAINVSSKRDQSAVTTQRTTCQSAKPVHKRPEPSNQEGPWNERRRASRTDSET